MPFARLPPLDAPDDFYEALLEAHRDLDETQSRALDARLVLVLAHHVGDLAALKRAIAMARATGPASGTPSAESE